MADSRAGDYANKPYLRAAFVIVVITVKHGDTISHMRFRKPETLGELSYGVFVPPAIIPQLVKS